MSWPKVNDYQSIIIIINMKRTITIFILIVAAVMLGCTKEQSESGLRIVDENGNEITALDFGDDDTEVSRLFSIVNGSRSIMSWQITTTADWIESVNKTSGVLPEGGSQGIIVQINKGNLPQGESTTTLYITSDKGSKQLEITAIGGVVSTIAVTSITEHTAVLNGKILQDVPYTEKGFVYGPDHNLSNRITVAGAAMGAFSKQVANLDATTTYYYKAYCVLNGDTYYGVEKSFGPYYNVPYFQYMGHVYMVAPDPGYELNWNEAKSYCDGLIMYGYSDWRMPTKMELQQMYVDRFSIQGFSGCSYWSSTKDQGWSSHYYYFYFCSSHENIGSASLNETLRVRPIRLCY